MPDRFTQKRLEILEAITTDPSVAPMSVRYAALMLLRFANRQRFRDHGVVEAWPPHRLLIELAGGSEESVRRAKHDLGRYMVATVGRGRGHFTVYRFDLPVGFVPRKALGEEGLSRRKTPRPPGLSGDGKPHNPHAGKPHIEPEKTPHRSERANPLNLEPIEGEPSERAEQLVLSSEYASEQTSISDGFERWWSCYPNKVAKKAARRLFDGVLRRGEATVDQLIEATHRYAESDPVSRGYCKNPSTWLNGACWLDQPMPAPNPTAAGRQGWSATRQAYEGYEDE